ncbi:hypothetical protein Klosneuvirus_1_309 [Klosneuvirus KNV1]|uniref:Uncharacterized protein n=1 Tax=Klosneuvirus KNV1 TaxID=1977640 RepID=A0A1V0SIA4_9VIRU|nr:hypothetical protein Klosneuvirus_1_309 [Klosneuvirus KNV1]
MGICLDKDNKDNEDNDSEQYIIPHEKTRLLQHINQHNYHSNHFINIDDFQIEYRNNDDEIFTKTYDQFTIKELFDELEEENNDIFNEIILKNIAFKINILTIPEINHIWEQYHMLIFNKIRLYPWFCIELKLNLLPRNNKLKYMEKMAIIIYDIYPNESVILLHNSIRKAVLLTRTSNQKIGDFLMTTNIHQQIMINSAFDALTTNKYGLSYLLFRKAKKYEYADNVLKNFAPEYIKLLLY